MIQYIYKIGKYIAGVLLRVNKNNKKYQHILAKYNNKEKTVSIIICKKSPK